MAQLIPKCPERFEIPSYLGMVPKDSPEGQAIEEHLLWCQECLAQAGASDRYVNEVRGAIIEGNFDQK